MSFQPTRQYRQPPSFAPSERTEHGESQRSYAENRAKYDDFSSNQSRLLSKERRLDEQFQNLLEKSTRSKELIDNAYQATFASNRLPSTLSSPKQDSLYSGSFRSPDGGLKSDNLFTSASNRIQPTKTSDYETNNLDDYNIKLEHEIQELKTTVIDRLRNQEAEARAREAERKSPKKPKIQTLSSSEDEQHTEKISESFVSKKANPKLHRLAGSRVTTKAGKSPENSTLRKRDQRLASDADYSDQATEYRAKRAVPNSKSKLTEAELALKEKYLALKYKAKEMRDTLQEYVDKCVELEEQLGNKDRVLIEYEDQVKHTKHELLRSFELLQEAKRSEDVVGRNAEDLRIQNTELKARVQEQKKKLDDLEEQFKRNDERLQTQVETLQNEKQEVKVSLRDREERVDHLAYANEKLRNELEQLQSELDRKEGINKRLEDQRVKFEEHLNELREKVETLQIDNKALQVKNEDLKENQAHLEDKLAKLKKKAEDERFKWENDREKEVGAKKEKTKQLKADIKDLEGLLQRATDEKKTLAIENEKNLTQKVLHEKELTRCREELSLVQQEMKAAKANVDFLKAQNDEFVRTHQQETDRALNVQTETRKISKAVSLLEEKLGFKEKEHSKSEELNARLRNELKILLEENDKYKKYISQVESELGYVRGRYEDEMLKFEAKLSGLEREILGVKDENTVLKSKQVNQTRDIESLREERNNYKRDYKAMKQTNKTLEKDLLEIDERVREFISEKQTEIRDHNKENIVQKQLNSKLKVLEDIQTMIRSHRHSHRNKYDLAD